MIDTFKDIEKLEADLWEAADNLRANSKLTSSDYFMPVLGVIFLRYAANRFEAASRQIEKDQAEGRMPKRKVLPEDYLRRAELCDSIDYGYTASAEQDQVGPKLLRITDIVSDLIDWSSVPYCLIEEDRLAKFRLNEGDIVIARTGAMVGYAKRLHKRHPESVFASYLVRLRVKPEVSNLMIGIFVESGEYKHYVQSRIGGAAQPNANAKVLAAAELLVPPARIQRSFHEYVEPAIDQREVLQLQNQNLKAARDLLLPRLMSGEIAV